MRRRLVSVFFAYQFAPQAEAEENKLWLYTAYALIQAYRSRLAKQDAEDAKNSRVSQHSVQMRKLPNIFRAFLSAEESFWSGFALRLVRTFGLAEAKPALLTPNITSPDPSDPLADLSHSSVPTIDDDPESRNAVEPSTALPPDKRDSKRHFLSIHGHRPNRDHQSESREVLGYLSRDSAGKFVVDPAPENPLTLQPVLHTDAQRQSEKIYNLRTLNLFFDVEKEKE
ncbi:hypothetical protein FS837_012913 [Tulasnella sp. UAMH 9824]|nr:hypothetical protein FS837_012913 [Tulasnella sp. UAMH 9824]